jgi:HK97 family phage portal protein
MLLKPSDFAQASPAPAQPAEKNTRARGGAIRERSHSDEIVTVEKAIEVSGVIAIISLISQDLASLPLILYGRRGANRFRAYDNPNYTLLHDSPNPEHTAVTFREYISGHVIAWGNFFAQIIFDRAGIARELWPLRPDRMTVQRIDGEKVFLYITPEGKQRVFFKDEILHIPGFGFDGLVGYSRIALARNAIGAAMSAEKFGSKFFANDTTLGAIFLTPNELSDTAYERLDKALNDEHKGVENAHNKIIFEEGLDVKRLGLPPEDSQYLQTRKFQLDEINRIIGPIPPHLYGDTEKSTSWGTGIDSLEQGYVNHSLRPHAVRIEQALWQQLLLEADRQQGLYFEHLFDALLRGDLAIRSEAYVKMLTNGVFTPNQVLAKENMNTYPGGDVHYRPANLVQVEPRQGSGQGPANAFEPLWRDAAQRAATREANDLRGAAHRFLGKGQVDSFNAWLDPFYSKDQPAFAMKQFRPVLSAVQDQDQLDFADPLEQYLRASLAEHRAALEGLALAEVEALADHWQKELAEQTKDYILDQLKQLTYENELLPEAPNEGASQA